MGKEVSKCFNACIQLATLWCSNYTYLRQQGLPEGGDKDSANSNSLNKAALHSHVVVLHLPLASYKLITYWAQTQTQTHPGIVQQARHLLVAKQGEDLSRRTGGDGEVVEKEPIWASIGRTGGRGGGRLPIRQVPTGGAAQARD